MHPPLVEFYGVTSTWCQENLPKCKYLSLTRAHSYSNGQFFRRFSFRFLRLAATRLKQGQTGKTEIFAMVNNTAKSQVYGIFTCIARTIWIKRNTLLQITNPNFNMAKCYLSFFTSHQSKLSPPPKKTGKSSKTKRPSQKHNHHQTPPPTEIGKRHLLSISLHQIQNRRTFGGRCFPFLQGIHLNFASSAAFRFGRSKRQRDVGKRKRM